MDNNKTSSSLLKKLTAALVSISMVMGAAAPLANVTSNGLTGIITASADEKEEPKPEYGTGSFNYGGNIFEYNTVKGRKETSKDIYPYMILTSVTPQERNVALPDKVTINGYTYEIKELGENFGEGIKTETMLIPASVEKICNGAFRNAEFDKMIVNAPDLKTIGDDFFAGGSARIITFDAPALHYVGNKFMEGNTYMDNFGETDDVYFGNLLVRYNGDAENIKVSELGDGKITCLGRNAFSDKSNTKSIDLTGVKSINWGTFWCNWNLADITGTDDVEYIDCYAFSYTAWDRDHAEDDLVTVGKVIYRYLVKNGILDLSDGSLDHIVSTAPGAIKCAEEGGTINTVIANYTTQFLWNDTIRKCDFKNMSKLVIDGQEVAYSEDQQTVSDFLGDHYWIMIDSKVEEKFFDDKVRVILNKLGLNYYGPDNDVIGSGKLTPNQEFHIALTIHDYVVTNFQYHADVVSYKQSLTCERKMVCQQYAELTAHLLECAGVDADAVCGLELDENGNTIFNGNHAWNLIKIGDTWFHADNTWDSNYYEQGGESTNVWFLSSDQLVANNEKCKKKWMFLHYYNRNAHFFYDLETIPECKINLGDANNDGKRDKDDSDLMMKYMVGIIDENSKDENGEPMIHLENCDCNFDGIINIGDLVLLNRIARGKTVDPFAPAEEEKEEELPETPQPVPEPKILTLKFRSADIYSPYDPDYMPGLDVFSTDTRDEPTDIPDGYYDTADTSEKQEDPEPSADTDTTGDDDTTAPVKGDINGDGKVNAGDITKIAAHIKGLKTLEDPERADLNGDKKVNASDIVALAAHIKGIKKFR